MRFQTTGPYVGTMVSGDSQGHLDSSIGWFGDKSLGNLVTQFTSVPEPSTLYLLVSGVLSVSFFYEKLQC